MFVESKYQVRPRRLVILLIGVVLVSGFSSSMAGSVATTSKQLYELFAKEWEFALEEDPLFATYVGDHRYNDKLQSVTLEDFARRYRANQSFQQRLRALQRDSLSQADRVNYDIFARRLRDKIAAYELKAFLMPISSIHGFHIEFPELPNFVPLRTVKDYENYLARLKAFGTYVDQQIELMRQGVRQGYVQPRVIFKGFEKSLTAHIVKKAEASVFYAPFANFSKKVPAKARQGLRRDGERTIRSVVVPAYERFYKFMKKEYVPATRASIGVSDLPNGKKFYQWVVGKFTTSEVSPQSLHKTGLREVKRIRAEMEQIMQQLQFKGGLQEFGEFLRTDPQFYAKSADELLKRVAYIMKKMDGELPRLFKTLPRIPCGIKTVPDYIAPKTTTAYYWPPAGDGSRAGIYYVNTYKLDSRPLYELEALSLHEALPGHHLQIALQQELGNLPQFRRFSEFTVFVEGWALYAERLGLEAGFYTDPYSNFGRLSYEMWRACRLVVDTGMHALGWSRDQAIEFLLENSVLTKHNIEAEVDRYIGWPGQALAYKTGELKIRQLRQEAEKTLGKKFNLREFHDVVLLGGSIPLDLLADNVHSYIQTAKSRGK